MSDYIEDKFYCQDGNVLYFVFYKDEPWLGVMILSSKALKKRKGWEHLLLRKETVLRLRDYISHTTFSNLKTPILYQKIRFIWQ